LFAVFSLILTFSLREKEQLLAGFLKSVTSQAESRLVLPKGWERFSLSQRERAGVRENIRANPRGHDIP
jgi:hypothetical protein